MPIFGQGRADNDYGHGFYCTEELELAREWACFEQKDGYANRYEIDMAGLSVLNLNSKEYSILHWLSVLVEHRRLTRMSPVMQAGANWLTEHFHVDLSQADIVVGYRADDSYFQFARAFLSNTISLELLSRTMKLGKLGEQIVLKSAKSFAALHSCGWVAVPHEIYYAKRRARDEQARSHYDELSAQAFLEPGGIYMRDIIMQKMEATDARLF